jgi:hypothetical protein
VSLSVRASFASAPALSVRANVTLILTHFIRTIWFCSRRRSESARALVPHPIVGLVVACAPGAIVVRFGVRGETPGATATNTPTIRRAMLDLCSTPCKARRFAPPARARGLRALTVPARRFGPGNHVMVGEVMMRSWADLGQILIVDRDSERR